MAVHQCVSSLSPPVPLVGWLDCLCCCFRAGCLSEGAAAAPLRSALGRHGLAGWRAPSVLRGTKYSSLHQEEDKLEREREGGRGVNIEYPRAIRESSAAGKF